MTTCVDFHPIFSIYFLEQFDLSYQKFQMEVWTEYSADD